MGYDPCGPEVQPTDDQGCHPVVGVPSERGPKPSPSGNPIAAPRFQNNRFNTFAEYVQHNKYMTNLNTSNSKTLAALKSKQIGDENYSKITVTPAKKSVIVFYSSTCEPSMKYLSSIQSNLTSIEINASLSICDIEQNPELRQQYGIEYTPTTVVIGNNKITMKVSGANKLPEVQKAIE